MTEEPLSLSEESADQLVSFLQSTGGEYVAVARAEQKSRPYFRAADWGGFIVKRLHLETGDVMEFQKTRRQARLDLAHAASVHVIPRDETPAAIWGTPNAPGGEHVRQ